MPLINILKKKDRIKADAEHPEFTFLRTTTTTEERIEPPIYPGDELTNPKAKRGSHRHLGFHRSANATITKDPTAVLEKPPELARQSLPVRPSAQRKLSERLHLGGRSRTPSQSSSVHLPDNLPDVPEAVAPRTDGAGDEVSKEIKEEREARWEKRATMLAMGNPLLEEQARPQQQKKEKSGRRSRSASTAGQRGDENIQEAIRLHEAGELEPSTAMFGRLADPKGANNALSQVLYGLALRHGWGIQPNPTGAITYLSLAASNSASIESEALRSGMKNGGAAKGELVLAIFELANCFRHGWGVSPDPVAARHYYETAANLGDTDALEEAAWCYLQGFGGGKDKFKAAQYLRLAEGKGHKTIGNTWIWKEKYDAK